VTVDGVRHRYLLLVALRWLPIGFVAPLLVLVLLERGLSLAQVGGVMAVYGITTAVLELPTGGLADTLGRRPVLLLSAVLGTAFMALVLVLHGVIGMAVAAFVGGVSRALDSGPLEAWFVDTTRQLDSDADLERGLSRGNMLDGVALAVGAVAGGVLPQLFAGRLDVSLVAALACHAAHVAAIATLMTETGPSRQERWRHAFARIPRVMRDGATLTVRHTHVRRLMLGFVAIGVCLSGVEGSSASSWPPASPPPVSAP
jgi:MFS family permease